MNRGELVSATAARCGIPTTDVLFDVVGDRVNEALQEMSDRNVAGWDWLTRDITLPVTTGDSEFTFDALAALLDENVSLLGIDPDETNLYPVTRILEVDYVSASGARSPMVRENRRTMNTAYVAGSDTTLGGFNATVWTAEGQRLIIAPTAASDFTAQLRVLIGERILEKPTGTAPEPSPLLPARYHSALLYLARALAYEMKQDGDASVAARALYDKLVMQAIAHSRPTGGPGKLSAEAV